MIRTLGVLGAGAMGRGIAQLAAQSGIAVRLFDPAPEALKSSVEHIRVGIEKGVAKNKLTQEQANAAMGLVVPISALGGMSGSEFIIEAAVEDLGVKKRIFNELGGMFGQDVPLASNTSSLSILDIAGAARHPERVLGMHFFNPPVAMKLVEIVKHKKSAGESFKSAWNLACAMDRTPVEVKDTAGFLVNRVIRSYYLVAQRLVAEGRGSYAEIDAAVKERGGVPMGPFELMDFIGLEVNFKITQSIYAGLGKPERLKPHVIQEKLVATGARGRKSGRGFYAYENGKKSGENPDASALLPKRRAAADAGGIWDSIMSAIAAEARIVVKDGVASEEGVDTAVKLAMRFPQGPFEWSGQAPAAP